MACVPEQHLPPPGFKLDVLLWDFAGQEVYYQTHQFFHSSRAIYLVLSKCCADLTYFDDTQLMYWLASIRSNCQDGVIFLVGTHADELDDEATARLEGTLNLESLQLAYSPIEISLHLVDSKTNKGVDKLRVSLLIETSKRAETEVPRDWLKLRDEIALKYNDSREAWHVPLSDLVGLVYGMGIEDIRKALTTLLHPMGEVLLFPKVGMEEEVVVRPQMLPNVFKCVIAESEHTARMIKSLSGVVVIETTLRGLFEACKSEAEFAYIVALLEAFELAFRQQDVDGPEQLVFPNLLNAKGPIIPATWQQQCCLAVKPPYIPIGLAGRLSCRLMVLHSQGFTKINKECWRFGTTMTTEEGFIFRVCIDLNRGIVCIYAWHNKACGKEVIPFELDLLVNQLTNEIEALIEESIPGLLVPKKEKRTEMHWFPCPPFSEKDLAVDIERGLVAHGARRHFFPKLSNSSETILTVRLWRRLTGNTVPRMLPPPRFVEVEPVGASKSFTGLYFGFVSNLDCSFDVHLVTMSTEKLEEALPPDNYPEFQTAHLRLLTYKKLGLVPQHMTNMETTVNFCLGFAIDGDRFKINSCSNMYLAGDRSLLPDQIAALMKFCNDTDTYNGTLYCGP